jgi:cytochrome c peroxidase
VEQNNASKEAVLIQVAKSKYAELWEVVWGEPVSYSTPEDVELNYDRIGLAIAEYEASTEVNSFTSKFDYYLQGLIDLTAEEELGMQLFNDEEKGKCSLCHISEPGENGEPPLFTDFTFDNLGTPKNPDNPFYKMDEILLPNGDPINPLGEAWIDYGLGGFLANHSNPDWQAMADENMGKHKVPTLRNVDKRPGNGFTKAYMHNGVFKSLKEVVHFYNTRDVGMWPPPEVAENVNTEELGDLGLTDEEEDAIVAFMGTLSDGYKLPKNFGSLKSAVVSENNVTIGPNPFKAQTTVSIYLDKISNVKINFYQLNGKLIKEIFAGWLEEGQKQVQVSGYDLESGVYIIGIQLDHKLITQKVTVVN